MSGPVKVVTAASNKGKAGYSDPRNGGVGRMGAHSVSSGGVDSSEQRKASLQVRDLNFLAAVRLHGARGLHTVDTDEL